MIPHVAEKFNNFLCEKVTFRGKQIRYIFIENERNERVNGVNGRNAETQISVLMLPKSCGEIFVTISRCL